MAICSKENCNQTATLVVRLKVAVEGSEIPAEVFADLYACSAEHEITDGEIHKFFRDTWDVLAMGFALRHLPRPVIEKTEFAWVPVEEYEAFKQFYEGPVPEDPNRTEWTN
jgi:hypothetical protein